MRSETSSHYSNVTLFDNVSESGKSRRRYFTKLSQAFADAQKRADESGIGQPLLDFLYSNRRRDALTQKEWEHHLKAATVLDENLTRYGCRRLLREIVGQIEIPLKAAVVQDRAPPALAITHHGGFATPLRRAFAQLFPGAVIVGANGRHTARDGAYALFSAREALLNGNPVLMAPDGRFGKEAAAIAVLGAQLPLTDGAPYLAHEAGCRVLWLTLTWNGHSFSVEAANGPQRTMGETFAAYRGRFFRFYAGQLEDAFTRHPGSMPLTANWKFVFDAMLAGNIHRVRRSTR